MQVQGAKETGHVKIQSVLQKCRHQSGNGMNGRERPVRLPRQRPSVACFSEREAMSTYDNNVRDNNSVDASATAYASSCCA